MAAWLVSIESQILYQLDHRKPVLNVIHDDSTLRISLKNIVPVGDTGIIPHHLHNAPGDHRPGAGDGCRMRLVNLWALAWSRDM